MAPRASEPEAREGIGTPRSSHRKRAERKGAEGTMTNIKTLFGLLVAVVAAVVGGVAFGAAQACASSAPIVIPYAKTCDETVGHCLGTAGDGGTFEMQITSFRATGKGAQLTLT